MCNTKYYRCFVKLEDRYKKMSTRHITVTKMSTRHITVTIDLCLKWTHNVQFGLVLRCLMPHSLIFYPEKTTDLSKVTDKLYHIMLYRVHLAWAGFELTILMVIGTDCIGSYKSNYHMITTTTAPHTNVQKHSWLNIHSNWKLSL